MFQQKEVHIRPQSINRIFSGIKSRRAFFAEQLALKDKAVWDTEKIVHKRMSLKIMLEYKPGGLSAMIRNWPFP